MSSSVVMLCVGVIFSILCMFMFVFFCKQMTAYEMRISDLSSDVCSSDLRKSDVAIVANNRTLRRQIHDAVAVALELARDRLGEQRRQFDLGKIGRACVGKEWVSTSRSRWAPYN